MKNYLVNNESIIKSSIQPSLDKNWLFLPNSHLTATNFIAIKPHYVACIKLFSI